MCKGMKTYSLEDLDKQFDLELDRVVDEIQKAEAKLVLVQFADGLKIFATSVVDYLEEKTGATCIIWLGSCFGACDYPVGIDHLKPNIAMMVQFGHNSLMPSY